jgi:rRNA processing protein Gar1
MPEEKNTTQTKTRTSKEQGQNIGEVKQIIGAVVEVYFENKLPDIYNALEVERPIS